MANKELDKNKTYLVLNYNPSPVAVPTKNGSYLIPGGGDQVPSVFPMDLQEIQYINNASKVFKIGLLYFEPEYEEQIYDELRITDWQNILRDKDIEDIVLNPTEDKLSRAIAIQDHMYFDRVYGVYMGLKNDGYPISGDVERVISARHKELTNGHLKTRIELSSRQIPDAASVKDEKISALEDKLARMEQMMAQMVAAGSEVKPTDATSQDSSTADTEKPKTTRGRKPKEE